MDTAAAVRAMVRIVDTRPPRPEYAAVYETKYARYKDALAALAPLWGSL